MSSTEKGSSILYVPTPGAYFLTGLFFLELPKVADGDVLTKDDLFQCSSLHNKERTLNEYF